MKTRNKAFDVIKAEAGKMAFLITSGAQDRDGEVLDPDGMMAESFMANPVFLWCHDLYGPPLGNVASLKRTEAGWEAEVDWLKEGVYPFADTIRGIYEDNKLHAVSVRFRPMEWEVGTLANDGYTTKFTKWELLELSAVNVPANQEALRVRDAGGVRNYIKSIIDVIGPEADVADTPTRTLAEDGPAGHSQAPAGSTLAAETDAGASSSKAFYCVVCDENGNLPEGYTDGWKNCTITATDGTNTWTYPLTTTGWDSWADIWESKITIKATDLGKTAAGDETAAKTDTAAAQTATAPPAETAQGTPAAEAGETSKTDDGGFDVDDLVAEPEPFEVPDAELQARIDARAAALLAERRKYLSGLAAVEHLLPENWKQGD